MHAEGHAHKPTNILGSGVLANGSKPVVGRVTSQSKLKLLNSQQPSPLLRCYCDELTCRFDRRTPRNPGQHIFGLLQGAVECRLFGYAHLIQGNKPRNIPPSRLRQAWV